MEGEVRGGHQRLSVGVTLKELIIKRDPSFNVTFFPQRCHHLPLSSARSTFFEEKQDAYTRTIMSCRNIFALSRPSAAFCLHRNSTTLDARNAHMQQNVLLTYARIM